MLTDSEFVLDQLQQGPATTMMLISASIRDRGCGLTPHSRVADLRRQGHDVRCERSDSVNGRPVYVYTLVEDAGFVESPARVEREQPGVMALQGVAPLDVIPGQLAFDSDELKPGERDRIIAYAKEYGPRSRREQGLPEKATGAELRRLVPLELAILQGGRR